MAGPIGSLASAPLAHLDVPAPVGAPANAGDIDGRLAAPAPGPASSGAELHFEWLKCYTDGRSSSHAPAAMHECYNPNPDDAISLQAQLELADLAYPSSRKHAWRNGFALNV